MPVEKIVIKGKHIYFEVALGWFKEAEVYDPFPVILLFDEHVLVGQCWTPKGGKLQGTCTDPLIVLDGLVWGLDGALLEPDEQGGCNRHREMAREYGFNVANDTPIYRSVLAMQSYVFFERIGDSVKIHYYNGLLEGTDCPEYKGKHKGTIEVPLIEFGEDVLRVFGEYLERHYKRVEKVRQEAYGYNRMDEYKLYLKQYLEDLEDWKTLKEKLKVSKNK
ncbi:hypothetical protein [Thermococcus gammatolerans]|uniref:hypothetical protein n=1 Tax=Thermococcus gammatolerans TaxID=187878 RepID=UPI0011D15CE7|nr:hypothetical protein [Thermococcus gammatolerans]